MSQAEAAAHVLQRHEAAGQAHQGHLVELRDAAVAHSAAIQQLISEAQSQAEQARSQQAELVSASAAFQAIRQETAAALESSRVEAR
eukprot:13200980-Alexandrium_andersonii.AAC.1